MSRHIGGIEMEFNNGVLEQIDLAQKNFAGFVSVNRKSRGFTFEELAERTNLSPSFIYRLEKGYRGCTLSSKVILLLDGFEWTSTDVLRYLEEVINDRESLKRIAN